MQSKFGKIGLYDKTANKALEFNWTDETKWK